MDDYGGRPHWGKRHYQTRHTLAPRYPGWERFQAVRAAARPRGACSRTTTSSGCSAPPRGRAALAAVGRHLVDDAAAARPGRATSNRSHSSPAFACRKYTRSPTVSDAAAAPMQRRLDLAGALQRVELQAARAGTARAGGRRRPGPRPGSRRRAAWPPGRWAAHHRQREHRGGPQRERRVVVEQGGRVEAGAGGDLGDRGLARRWCSRLPVPPPFTKLERRHLRAPRRRSPRAARAISADRARCIRRITARAARSARAVAHARDVALVAHQPGQLEARAALRSRARARRACVGRADGRALGPDLHPPAGGPLAQVHLDADARSDGRRPPRCVDEVEVLDRVDHHDRRALGRRAAPSRASPCAVGGRVGSSRSSKPCSRSQSVSASVNVISPRKPGSRVERRR